MLDGPGCVHVTGFCHDGFPGRACVCACAAQGQFSKISPAARLQDLVLFSSRLSLQCCLLTVWFLCFDPLSLSLTHSLLLSHLLIPCSQGNRDVKSTPPSRLPPPVFRSAHPIPRRSHGVPEPIKMRDKYKLCPLMGRLKVGYRSRQYKLRERTM